MWNGLQGQAYSDPGATAYDADDGAITDITVTGLSAVDTMVVSAQLLAVWSYDLHYLPSSLLSHAQWNSAAVTFVRYSKKACYRHHPQCFLSLVATSGSSQLSNSNYFI